MVQRMTIAEGLVFNIQKYSVQDGPGIRTTVFLKGCPLRCLWCSNPESQAGAVEVGIVARKLCTRCGRCLEACPEKAIVLAGDDIRIKRESCSGCGKCADACYEGVFKRWGTKMSVGEVIREVETDRVFYRTSGGGVTLSGGEPLSQPDFALTLLHSSAQKGIHTCVETCGLVAPIVFEKASDDVDLFLYDLKEMDSGHHQKLTGVPNELILNNARLIAGREVPMIMRVPVIPSLNDSEENIRAIAEFTYNLKSVREIDLLPYHSFGIGKYEALGRQYSLLDLSPCSEEKIERLKKIVVNDFGFKCAVGG